MIFRVRDKGAYILRFSVHLDATDGSVESGHACVFEVHMVDMHNRHNIATIGYKRVASYNGLQGCNR